MVLTQFVELDGHLLIAVDELLFFVFNVILVFFIEFLFILAITRLVILILSF